MIEYRKTQMTDIVPIMEIIREAQCYFKSQCIDQWQNDYPNENTFRTDIDSGNSYVFIENDKIIATAMISFDKEPTYDQIKGEWLSENSYAVIHRIAVKSEMKGKNIAGKILEFTKCLALDNNIHSIRIDTHRDNSSMQRVITKFGFFYCGLIYLNDGAERFAYQYNF
ncbi:MAG: GNAT family N-acetyltransferase [Bacteroidales bacterium]